MKRPSDSSCALGWRLWIPAGGDDSGRAVPRRARVELMRERAHSDIAVCAASQTCGGRRVNFRHSDRGLLDSIDGIDAVGAKVRAASQRYREITARAEARNGRARPLGRSVKVSGWPPQVKLGATGNGFSSSHRETSSQMQ